MKKTITKFLSVLLVLVFVFGTMPVSTNAQVYGNDYPYPNADTKKADPWGYYYRQCTSFVAWRLNSKNGVSFNNWYKGVNWGNAKTWISAAQKTGVTVNNTPAVGAVGCTTAGEYGHVVWVAEVNGSNVTVEEYNYNKYAYSCRTVPASSFQYIHIKDLSKQPVNRGDDFYAYIIKASSWKHLENNSGNVTLSKNGIDCYSPKQIWHFIRQSNGSYKIINEYDGTCLTAENSGTDNGTNVKTSADNGSSAQRWYIYDGVGGYNLGASYCDKVLDSTGGNDSNGNNIQLYDVNNSAAQALSIYNLMNDGLDYSKPQKPAKPNVSVSVNGKKATFTWTKSDLVSKFDDRIYDIRIFDENENIILYKVGLTSTSYTYDFSNAGKYKVNIAAVNGKYWEHFTFSDEVNFCVHSYSESIINEPTCTEKGTKRFICSFCGSTYESDIQEKGHTNVTDKAVKATYAKEGKTEGKHCKTCGKVITAQKSIAKLSSVELSETSYVYNGKAKKPTVKVLDSNGKEVASSNYTVTYSSGRKLAGKYSVTVVFNGDYSGSKTLYFTINPKPTTISKLTAASKGVTVSWKKASSQVTGYQIQCATNSNFTLGKKTVTVSNAKKTSGKIEKLKGKKKYYVRVRTYKTVNGTNYYSSWSSAKTVTTKK